MTTDSVFAHDELIVEANEKIAFVLDHCLGNHIASTMRELVDALEQQSSLLATARADGKREGLEEAAQWFDSRLPDGTPNGRAYNSYTVARLLRDRVEGEEKA